jgi:hypothetical protein
MSEQTPNITKIPASRVPLSDPRTGLISHEWFRFFNNIYTITGGTEQGITQIINGGTGASTAEQARDNLGAGTVRRVIGTGFASGLTLVGEVTDIGTISLEGEVIADLSGATGVLAVANGGTGLSARPSVVTKTADFTLADTEGWVINNKSGSTCTVTLPAASLWGGRSVTFKNLQAQTLVSAASDVAPIGSATLGTAILPASVGAWATLVSDGANWVVMQS